MSMMLAQNLCLSIGATRSIFMQMKCGILQGSRFSPLFFISLVDWAFCQGEDTIRGLLLIFADDFLILSLINDRVHNMQTLQNNLAFIGLEVSQEKSYQIINIDKWVGIAINKYGLGVDLQFEHNIAKAEKRFWRMIKLGNWKGHYPDQLALAAYRSQVISVVEYGISAFDPCLKSELCTKLAAKVDVMINRHIRIMLGLPQYLPIEDMHSLFQYCTFAARWTKLRSRFYNHLSSESNTPALIQFTHDCVWKFQLPDCLEKFIASDTTARSFLYRLYAKPDESSICKNCNGPINKSIM